MKRFLLLFLALPVFAAPSTPITRGRLTTDMDGAGHSITNSPMATTNFVLEVVGSVTNNLPSGGGGITTNDVRAIVADEYLPLSGGEISGGIVAQEVGIVGSYPYLFIYDGAKQITVKPDGIVAISSDGSFNFEFPRHGGTIVAASSNVPPVSASATIGDFVDTLNAVIGALRKEDEE